MSFALSGNGLLESSFDLLEQSTCESVGGMVFLDNDKDGCHYPFQEGYIEGVDVYLFSCNETDASVQNALAFAITDSHGAYTFGPNQSGRANICLHRDSLYYVWFDITSVPASKPDLLCFTQGDGTNCYNSESRDDVVDWTTGTTDCYNPTGDDNDDDIVGGVTFCENVIDLALMKEIATPGPYETGDVVEFVISVVNQGDNAASEIEVVDHVPPGFSFDPALNTAWDNSTAPMYTQSIAGTLLPGETTSLSIFLNIEYLEDQSEENYTNIAEIGSAKDGNGDPAVDIDSTPDNDPDNDGDIVIDNSLDDKDDEDDHDPELLPLPGNLVPGCTVSCELACIGQLNLSLGSSCEAIITPSMLIPGLESSCDNASNAAHFEITLTDQFGDPITGSGVGAAQLGQLLQYSIEVTHENLADPDLSCQNSCWGNILVESKIAPVLNCSEPIDTISCLELTTFDGPPLIGAATGCFTTEVTVEILNEQFLKVDECDSEIIQKLIRQYQAVDLNGNRSNICTQELHVVKLDTALISFPPNGNQNLQCNEDFLVIDTSNLTDQVVPFYNPATGSGIALYPLPVSSCNIFVDFTDEVILDLPCKKQVLRTWNVRQWHCNDEFSKTMLQMVTLVDTIGPAIECPTETIEVNTSGSDCTARVLLPEITAVDSCQGDISHIDMSFPGGIVENQNGGEVSGIPVGLHAVTYTAYDACHNSTSCAVYVNVKDERPPVIICESHVVVSIPTTGEAHVPADRFDDGSYDDCAQVILKVRRMDLSCQKSETDSTSIEFGDYVPFCCADADGTHMVVLRAYEHTSDGALGRYNECMIEVTVADKNPPSLVAPPDVTVSCDFIFDDEDLRIFGKIADSEFAREPIVLQADSVNIEGSGFDGLVVGACGAEMDEDVQMGNVNSCGIGRIVRTFSASSNGITVTDQQVITVVSPIPFDSTRIIWPRDTIVNNICDVQDLHPDNLLFGTDRPRIDNGTCELLGISITEERLFDPVRGGDACFKLFRTWSVIDWCDTDTITYLPARWDSTQLLSVVDTEAPDIMCPDTEVYNSFDANCNPVPISLSVSASGGCTPDSELFWTWIIDLNSDGTIDTTGLGNTVSAAYVPGLHQITWYAEDLCGNVSDPCEQDFEITNEKAAPAICLDHVVTDLVLMDLDFDGTLDTEMVEIWVSDVVKIDSHSCGHELSYSFSQDTLDAVVRYNCDNIGFNEVKVWVTDLVNGAQSFCKTEIEVQDNNLIDICGGLIHNPDSDSDVSGLILTESGSQVAEASVKMLGSEIPNAMTDGSGMYAFESMPIGGNYTVAPEKDINYINGVSTLDLVLIQKHILGLEILDSPYKILAADINNSNTVSAADIVQLRKLILGEIDEYSNNNSWRFVDEGHEFTQAANPWSSLIPETYDIVNFTENMEIDFVGVKIGDVSGNAKGTELVTAEARTSKEALRFIGTVSNTGLIQEVAFSSSDFTDVTGYQMTMEYDATKYELINVEGEALNLTDENIGLRYADRGMVTTSWHSEEGVSASGDEVLFRASFRAKTNGLEEIEIASSSAITVKEAYVRGEVTDKIEIEMTSEISHAVMVLNQNEPNPWRERTILGFYLPESGKVTINLYDNTGRMIKNISDTYSSGHNEITISRDIINRPGIYLYEVAYKDQLEYKRMIVLD